MVHDYLPEGATDDADGGTIAVADPKEETGEDVPQSVLTLADLESVLTVLKIIRLYEYRPTRHLVRPKLLELGLDSFTVDERAPGGRSNVLEAEQLLAEYSQHEPAAWERT